MESSFWFDTRSALFTSPAEAWTEVARYEQPLRRLLARRYRRLGQADRDDLVQDILLEMRTRLVKTYERSRGRFRNLLQVVVRRRVIDHLRARRPLPLDEEAAAEALVAPSAEEIGALDLESSLLEAVQACRDRFLDGPERDPELIHALVARLVRGRGNVEIARTQGVSVHVVARRLRRAREAIFSHLLAGELGLTLDSPALSTVTQTFKRCLREPRARRQHLETLADARLREALEAFLERFRATLPLFQGDASAAGRELRRGLELLFEESPE